MVVPRDHMLRAEIQKLRDRYPLNPFNEGRVLLADAVRPRGTTDQHGRGNDQQGSDQKHGRSLPWISPWLHRVATP